RPAQVRRQARERQRPGRLRHRPALLPGRLAGKATTTLHIRGNARAASRHGTGRTAEAPAFQLHKRCQRDAGNLYAGRL
ncbi:uncharacterized protein METZ01_LOCUS417198, partial [marine metagenome]